MMAGRTYQEPWQAQEAFLLSTLQLAALAGGPLSTLKAVEEIAPPAGTVEPILGFQHRGSQDTPIGQNRIRQINTFEFNLVIARNFDPLVTDAARQVKLIAEKLWNDQQGNGLGAVLRANPTLGGLCTTSAISAYRVSIGRGILEEDMISAVVIALLTTQTDDFAIF